jgi:hypothetical protein
MFKYKLNYYVLMRYSPKTSALYTAVVAGALGACGPSDNVQQPSQLEQTVALAEEKAQKGNLDLSTPEGVLGALQYALKNKDHKLTKKIFSDGDGIEQRELDMFISVGTYRINSRNREKVTADIDLTYRSGSRVKNETEDLTIELVSGKWKITKM